MPLIASARNISPSAQVINGFNSIAHCGGILHSVLCVLAAFIALDALACGAIRVTWMAASRS
jgi:hypothetical protein